MIRAVISDMDGTLINYFGTYDPNIEPLIAEIKKRNIYFSVATGKGYYGDVVRIVKELDVSPLNIFNAGGMILDWKTGQTPWLKPISTQSLHFITHYISKRGVVFSLETKSHAYMLDVIPTPAYPESTPLPFTLDRIPNDVLKILIHAGANKLEEKDVDSFLAHITAQCKDVESMKFHIGTSYGLDVTSEESTKHTAVLEYAKILGLSRDELVGIGDSHNDYPLFTACGYTIAMGNAPKELREIASMVVKPTSEGGMVEALNHIRQLI
jgi:Cof subfamily protein (haloacid dehalogenase superfamily)